MSTIDGVGPNVEIVTNEKGGKQSDSPYGFHLMDAKANFALAKVLAYGAKRYTRDNWRLIGIEDHLNHALQHIFAYMAGDEQDEHLEHALCRLHFAVAVDKQDNEFWEEKLNESKADI